MYTQNKRAYSRNCAWEFRRQMAPISKLRSSKRRNFSQKEVTSGNRIPEERSLRKLQIANLLVEAQKRGFFGLFLLSDEKMFKDFFPREKTKS